MMAEELGTRSANTAAKISFAPWREAPMLFVRRMRYASQGGTLILQFAVVHHVRHFEATIDLQQFAELRDEPHFAAGCLQKRCAIQGARKNELCAQPVISRRTIVHQFEAFAVLAFEICH